MKISAVGPVVFLVSVITCGCSLVGYDALTVLQDDEGGQPTGGLHGAGGGGAGWNLTPSTGGLAVQSGGGVSAGGTFGTGGLDLGGDPETGGASAGLIPSGGSDARGSGTSGGAVASGGGDASGGSGISGGAVASGGGDASGGSGISGGTVASGGGDASGGSGGAGGSISTGGDDGSGGIVLSPTESVTFRLDFRGTGSSLRDTVSGQEATIRGGATLNGRGAVSLDGVNDYIDLPNGLLSARTDATIMAWVRLRSATCDQPLLDFGLSSGGEGNSGSSAQSVSISPNACGSEPVFEGGYFDDLSGPFTAYSVSDYKAADTNQVLHVAMVLSASTSQLRLYLNGRLLGESPFPVALEELDDVNNWLGRSQWESAPYLQADYLEFRIYGRALLASEVNDSIERGPDLP